MRNLNELRMNEIGPRVDRNPPSDAIIDEFQSHFGIALPHDYVQFLKHTNGGYSRPNLFLPKNDTRGEIWALDHFYHLEADREDLDGLWTTTRDWSDALQRRVVPIGCDGTGNQVVLLYNQLPPSVAICIHDEEMALLPVADSFGEFIDMLTNNLSLD
jgi:hypothetical protein